MTAMEDDPTTLIAALEHAPSGIAVLGDHGCIEWVNQRMGRLLQRERDELVGSSLGELMHPADFQPPELELGELQAGRVRDCGRKRFARPDGTFVWTGLTLSPFSTSGALSELPNGSTHLVANVFDLTELVSAERRLASVVAGLDEAVVSIDSGGHIAVANPAAERLLGSFGAPLVGLDLTHVPWEVIDEAGEPLPPRTGPSSSRSRPASPHSRRRAGAKATRRVGSRSQSTR